MTSNGCWTCSTASTTARLWGRPCGCRSPSVTPPSWPFARGCCRPSPRSRCGDCRPSWRRWRTGPCWSAHYREHPEARPARWEVAIAAAELSGHPLAARPDLVRRAADELGADRRRPLPGRGARLRRRTRGGTVTRTPTRPRPRQRGRAGSARSRASPAPQGARVRGGDRLGPPRWCRPRRPHGRPSRGGLGPPGRGSGCDQPLCASPMRHWTGRPPIARPALVAALRISVADAHIGGGRRRRCRVRVPC